ncbi:MAG: hypothetical protein HS132_14670 [Planctomycetia bacterium]|nr:hypothetical protein [Planctomycetia bacterium]
MLVRFSSENVALNKSVDAGKDIAESAGKNISLKSGTNMALNAGADFSINGGKKGVINIKDELLIKCGDASISLKKNGDIVIDGKKITIKGSSEIKLKGAKITEN